MPESATWEARPPRDIVLLYGPPWHGAAQFSKHHLARFLGGRGHRVLYVEVPLGSLSVLYRRAAVWPELRSTFLGPRLVAPNVWVRRHFNPVPYHAVTPLTASLAANRLGQRLLAPMLRRDLGRLGFHRPTLIAGLPHAVDLLPGLPRAGLVYHCADDYVHVRGFPHTLPRLEEALCRAADLVVTTAQTLCESRRRWNANTHWIPNGADVEHFSRPAAPAEDVARLPGPRVGFIGALAQWVDLRLIAELARAHPAWSVVLVGPVSTDLAPVAGVANVHVLGPRGYADVPRYLAAMDVALVPFTRDEVTRNADPIKVYEYLAAGVPVAATRMPGLERLGHVVRLADTPETFVQQVEQVVAEGRDAGRAARQAEAERHSWASRFETFERLLAETVPA